MQPGAPVPFRGHGETFDRCACTLLWLKLAMLRSRSRSRYYLGLGIRKTGAHGYIPHRLTVCNENRSDFLALHGQNRCILG